MNVWSILMPKVQGSHSHIHKNQKVDSFFLMMTMVRKLCYCNPNNVATHSPPTPKKPAATHQAEHTTLQPPFTRPQGHSCTFLQIYICMFAIYTLREVWGNLNNCASGERGEREREKENLDRFKRRTQNPKPFLPSTIAPAFLGFFRNILPKSI